MNAAKLESTVNLLAGFLARMDYDGFCAFARNSRLSPSEVRRVVLEYGRCLVPLPDAAHHSVNTLPISGSDPPQWNVIVPLWSREEGRSDLSLDINVQDGPGETLLVDILDLHVL